MLDARIIEESLSIYYHDTPSSIMFIHWEAYSISSPRRIPFISNLFYCLWDNIGASLLPNCLHLRYVVGRR